MNSTNPLDLFSHRHPLPREADPEGEENKLQIKAEALFPDIDEVIAKFLPGRGVVAAVNLSEAGEAGPLGMSQGIPGHFLQIPMDENCSLRAWAHKAHGALQDVEKLGQFVHGRLAHELTNPGDAGVRIGRKDRAAFLLRLLDHGTELELCKPLASSRYANLGKKQGSGVFEPDGKGCNDPDGGGEDQADEGK